MTHILPKATPACDDKEGHYIVVPGDLIFNWYRTAWLLGRTPSPKPLEASTQRRRTESLLKSSTLLPGPLMPSFEEEYHSTVIAACHCCAIHLLHWFDHRNHICIVTELLGMYVFLLHDLKLIHTDLKLEYILLVRNDYRTISLPIPGESAALDKESYSTVVTA
ncbi:hypothetical protein DL96DRAFT_1724275 [Flagelloscypha sp. PMI_526]|nr:hypothetical protein DL96DRAFT_1724275 [Flagelloscypha sp. PMI_526]